VGRTAVVYAPAAILLAVCWLRLESPREAGAALVLLVLALLPALLPALRLRLAAAVVAGLVAVPISLGVSPFDEQGIWRTIKDGFLEFYDVAVPFDPARHPDMHGVLLLALFVAGLCLALAIASRRPFLAVLALVAGAGWPATLVTDAHELTLGIALLAGALWILAALRTQASRTARPALVAGALLVLAAGAAASTDAVAKDALLGWERWDLYDSPAVPVGVDYVWDASYDGLDFPDKRTVVLRIRAPRRALYWRATTLDAFGDDRWFENLYAVVPGFVGGVLPTDSLVPRRPRQDWVRQQVEVVGLRDEHLVAASTPVQLRADDLGGVFVLSGGVMRSDAPPDKGTGYTVWSSVAQPTPGQLAAAGAKYPAAVQRYLDVDPRIRIRSWGDSGRAAQLRRLFTSPDSEYLWPYGDMERVAERVTRGARSPYAAVVALENWFRRSGGFRYDEHPPQPQPGEPALADFVLRTKAGYCQHYAGAMALMLRYLGIPARVAAGFTSGRFEDGVWTITDHDAHTWVEAWFPGYGWLSFDPTPGRGQLSALYTVASDSAEASAAIGAATQGVGGGLDPTAGGPRFDGGSGTGNDGGGPVRLIWLAALVLAAVTLGIGLVKLVRRRLRYATRDPRRRAAAARRELADFLADQGLDVPASATLSDLRRLLSEQLGVNARPFVAAAGAARWGRPADVESASRRTRSELRALLQAVRSRLSTTERARGWIALRSLRRA
jgi:transglutaminase-like putative cysteine protease